MIMKDASEKTTSKRNSFIRLSLRKPREWKVALTTSVSSPAIIPPKIQLWDAERGDILLDTEEECPRSKSASFLRRSPATVWVKKQDSRENTSVNRGSDKTSKYGCTSNPTSTSTSRHGTYQPQDDAKQRPKATASGRINQGSLVNPEEYVRPPTPVMVARRISLTRDFSTQTVLPDATSSTCTPNGITTHHRKQYSDSVLLGNRRKVKNSVSFGKVDTFDDSSVSSTLKNRDRNRASRHSSYSSSPQIVITEIVDSGREMSNQVFNPEKTRKKSKQRSRSGIPIRVKTDCDSSVGDAGGHGSLKEKTSTVNHITQNGHSGRKSRIDAFRNEDLTKHKINSIRSYYPPEPPPLLPPSYFYQQEQNSFYKHCERGNCPLDKYFNHEPEKTHSYTVTNGREPHRNMHSSSSRFTGSYPVDVILPNEKTARKPKHSVHEKEKVKQEISKPRRRRIPSRNRQRIMSSSSSESDDCWKSPRLPPRRRNRSQNPKGDRLVGVNGQCVRNPLEAEELLSSGDVVRLHLQRHGVTQSLPRHGVEEEATMGSNMSRHSGKGLTGRRSQSSGNLCNGKATGTPGVARFFSPCGRGANDSVGPRDRYKFCGSLPNHLDAKEEAEDPKSDVVLRLHPLVDQGYASERSPEDELPPPLPPPNTADQLTCPVHHPAAKPTYPFLQNNSTFTVRLAKSTRGLGLSVTGGVDTEEPWPGLIRVKRLFPHQPAWQSGQLAQGDFLLVANNTSLVGLTNYEALEVLRTTPVEVVLTVCRPPPELQVLSAPPLAETAPLPPKRDSVPNSSLQLPLKRMESFGEFELTLKKVNGSLGFTLRKEDESVLGHYVRALVREPALSDGRIKPGDKIVAVNAVDMSPMSHEEAVMFLRQCGQEVHLKLFRDPAQTPVQALSPTEHHRTFKPILRKEAQDMLSDLAVKKSMSPNESSGSSTFSNTGRTSSPRKRRLTKTPSPDPTGERPENHLSWSDDVLDRVPPGFEGDKPRRPDTLHFTAERKPHFQFSAMNSCKTEESLNSLENLDRMSGSGMGVDSDLGVGPLPSEPVSMPPLLSSTSDSTIGFSYRNPAYRSANPAPSKSKTSLAEDLPENRCSDNDLSGAGVSGAASESSAEGSKGLLKWKGVVFTPEDGADTATSPDDSISQITEVDTSSNQVLVVELNRGWNSRLGFSLQQSGRNTLISAIHSDSVASRDGRLKAGDQLITVNDESVEGMSTTEVINLLRKIRGSICITVWRKSS